MKAYNGDENLKAILISQVREHREADRLVKGIYRDLDGRGCAVGCLTRDPVGGHAQYELWGIPVELAHLEDAIFEGLPEADAQMWPERFLSAIKPGADLRSVWPRWRDETLRLDLRKMWRDRVWSWRLVYQVVEMAWAEGLGTVQGEARRTAELAMAETAWKRMADRLIRMLEDARPI